MTTDLEAPRSTFERTIGGVLFACALVSVVTTAGIILVLITETVGFFREVPLWRFLGELE